MALDGVRRRLNSLPDPPAHCKVARERNHLESPRYRSSSSSVRRRRPKRATSSGGTQDNAVLLEAKHSRTSAVGGINLFLGAHGSYYDVARKYELLPTPASNPFIDPDGYHRYVTEREQAFRAEQRAK